jgi:hypothetical protein
MSPESACGSKEVDLPLSRFPLRGQAGAGGFPPRRNKRGSPHKRGCRPLVHPPPGLKLPRAAKFRLASTAAAR